MTKTYQIRDSQTSLKTARFYLWQKFAIGSELVTNNAGKWKLIVKVKDLGELGALQAACDLIDAFYEDFESGF